VPTLWLSPYFRAIYRGELGMGRPKALSPSLEGSVDCDQCPADAEALSSAAIRLWHSTIYSAQAAIILGRDAPAAH
jgi:hypothetical protein